MKIALVANKDWNFFAYRSDLIEDLQQKGHEVILLSPGGPYVPLLQQRGFEWVPVFVSRKGLNPFDDLRTLLQLFKIYRKHRFDVVHHYTSKCVIYGSFAARAARVPRIINSITGLGYAFIKQGAAARLLRALISLLYKLSLSKTSVIFQNRNDLDRFVAQGILQSNAATLIRGSGVNTKLFDVVPEPHGTPQVVMIARLLWDKGVGEFVEAARLLKSRGLQADFVLVGDVDPGNPSSVSVEYLRSQAVQYVVHWAGWTDDLPPLYQEANLICLPTYSEGLPKVLIEAGAAGRAVVATDIPGCREVINDGVNGLLVPVKDVEALAAAIEQLIQNPAKRKAMGFAAREIVMRDFDVVKINEAIYQLYQKT
ncbi:MAG: glycosyltransferase family 4 protein [Anaerolineales bacterium]|nr:MAG: glycosyltransferase family 4 protein [Anaerolineales bacterium]